MTGTAETHPQFRIPTPDGGEATMVRTWSDSQIVRMLKGALDVVEELEPPDDLRVLVFQSALNLTGQMALRQSGIVAPPSNLSAFDGRQM